MEFVYNESNEMEMDSAFVEGCRRLERLEVFKKIASYFKGNIFSMH
jgi:hypothetical protein